ncbi:MAG: glutathione S-transferase N-terminal domain-containing protein [Sandaracinaceae bacterium]|nr:glutathione S-transferase N-terminal domain-containing protein [Sandaracinaceae bacterium]
MQLYIFPISHFSEKARWACDHHGVAYELVRCVPGPHVATMKRLGVKRTTVPVLTCADGPPIQGSGRIIAHLDGLQPARSHTR